MTDYEREKIYELRMQGLGYKAIGNILGLTRDAVRSFCKRNNLNGNGEVVSLNVEVMKEENLLCLHCGRLMKPKEKGRPRKFCSEECRRIWWKNNQDKRNENDTAIYNYNCLHCGKEFSIYGNKKRKFCSHDCYIKYRFWKDGEDEI
ncbi:RNA polymerase subunit sigma-70 [Tissierella sp.]|uniref:RNA polymerase subunit sigma-70 n=1 Tax=Tissierella sp. TaxID=41274 RepID=UPI00302D6268